MPRVIFNTAATLDGFLADDVDSLDWLFRVPGSAEAEAAFPAFLEGIGALVMGSTTYEWVHRHQNLAETPQRWTDAYGDRFTVVLTTRDLPPIPGVDVRFHDGAVGEIWPELHRAARERDVWVVGGGDVAGQFADAGLLDEVRVSIAPVTLGSGRPLLPAGSSPIASRSSRRRGRGSSPSSSTPCARRSEPARASGGSTPTWRTSARVRRPTTCG